MKKGKQEIEEKIPSLTGGFSDISRQESKEDEDEPQWVAVQERRYVVERDEKYVTYKIQDFLKI
jgi:hypothetical protein